MDKCYTRPTSPNVIFCELPHGHDGIHQSMQHEWELDGTDYREVVWSERRLTVDEMTR